MEAIRAFLAIPIPIKIAEKIYSDFSDLDVKHVPPKNMHITLNFLGNVKDHSYIKEKMDSLLIPKFKVKLKGVSAFPSLNFIRVLYVKVGVDSFIEKELKEFSNSIGGEPFSSLHLTIARVKKKITVDFSKEYDYGEFYVEKIALYQSILKKPYPEYKEIYSKLL